MDVKDQIRTGMHVRSTDGEKLGKIIAIEGDEFIIEKGLLFKEDYRARFDRITGIEDGDVIYLRQGEAPLAEGRPAEERLGEAPAGEEVRIPLASEEIAIEKEVKQAPAVRVHKEVVTEEQQVTVPVRREEVVVERERLAEPRAAGPEAFAGTETVGVSAMEEEVRVEKRPVVREEVRVRKQPVVEQRAASEEVRRETADIEEVEPARVERRDETEGGIRAPGRDEDKKL